MCIWVCSDPARKLATCKGRKARRALLQSARDGTRRLQKRRTSAELYPRAAQEGKCTPTLRRVSEKQNKNPVPRPCGSFPKKERHAFGIHEILAAYFCLAFADFLASGLSELTAQAGLVISRQREPEVLLSGRGLQAAEKTDRNSCLARAGLARGR